MKKLLILPVIALAAIVLGNAPVSVTKVANDLNKSLPVETTASTDWHVAPVTDRVTFVEMVLPGQRF